MSGPMSERAPDITVEADGHADSTTVLQAGWHHDVPSLACQCTGKGCGKGPARAGLNRLWLRVAKSSVIFCPHHGHHGGRRRARLVPPRPRGRRVAELPARERTARSWEYY